MEEVLETLKRIEKRIDVLEKNSEKMSDHINFIQKTYNVLRAPLNYVRGVVMGVRSSNELPLLENNNEEE